MADALVVLCVLIVCLGWWALSEAINNRGLCLPSCLERVVQWVIDSDYTGHAAMLESYGDLTGLQLATHGAGFREMPAAQGMLHGAFVVVTYSVETKPPKTVVTACTTRNDVEPQCVANWLTPEISKALSVLPNDAYLALVDGRFVLSLRGIHLESVATLDRALEVVLCAALGRSVAPLRR